MIYNHKKASIFQSKNFTVNDEENNSDIPLITPKEIYIEIHMISSRKTSDYHLMNGEVLKQLQKKWKPQ